MNWRPPSGVNEKYGRLDAIACGTGAVPGVHADWLPTPPGANLPLPESAFVPLPPEGESGWPSSLDEHVHEGEWHLEWISEPPNIFQCHGKLHDVAVRADGRLAVVTDVDHVIVWDVMQSRECFEVALPGDGHTRHTAYQFALTPDGSRLIVLCPFHGLQVSVIELVSQRPTTVTVPAWCTAEGDPDQFCVRVSHNGRLAVVGSNAGSFVFDVATGDVRLVLREIYRPFGFSPDDQWLLAADASHLLLFDVERDVPPQRVALEASEPAIWKTARISPNGDEVWALSGPSRVERYDLRRRRLIEAHQLYTHDLGLRDGLCISPVAPQFVVRDNYETLRGYKIPVPCVLFDLNRGPEPIRLLDENAQPITAHCGQFSGDGRLLILGSFGSLYVYDTHTARLLTRIRLSETWEVTSRPAFDAGGNRLLCAVERPYPEKGVCCWDLPERPALPFSREPAPLLFLRVPPKCSANAVAFSPEGSRVVASNFDLDDKACLARVWECTTGELLHVVRATPDATVHHFRPAVALSKDMRWLYLFAKVGYVFEVESGRIIAQFDIGAAPRRRKQSGPARLAHFDEHPPVVVCASFSSCGRWVLTGDADATATLWDVAAQARRWSYRRRFPTIYDVSFSADDSLACIHTDHGLRTLRTSTGRCVSNENDRTKRAPRRRKRVQVTPEPCTVDRSGTRLATVGPGRSILVYRTQSSRR